jgi:TatD DNase family protein
MPPALLVDTHAHLVDRRLRDDLPGVLSAARTAGVGQVVSMATTAEDSLATLEIARSHPGVFAAVGIHPNDGAEAEPGDWERVVGLVRDARVVAIGETGLDRYWDRTPFPLQQELFGRHLELARDRGLPVVIHSRDCMPDILDQLRGLRRPVSGVLHSFTGTLDDARALLDLGLHISFAGMVTFESKGLDALREVAAEVPQDRILIETDSPYLSPHPYRGKLNSPARVVVTAAFLARLRGIEFESFAEATTANARRLFGLPSDDTLTPSSVEP